MSRSCPSRVAGRNSSIPLQRKGLRVRIFQIYRPTALLSCKSLRSRMTYRLLLNHPQPLLSRIKRSQQPGFMAGSREVNDSRYFGSLFAGGSTPNISTTSERWIRLTSSLPSNLWCQNAIIPPQLDRGLTPRHSSVFVLVADSPVSNRFSTINVRSAVWLYPSSRPLLRRNPVGVICQAPINQGLNVAGRFFSHLTHMQMTSR